jgi:carbamate kinase
MMEICVFALGGNALLRMGERPTFAQQAKNARKSAMELCKFISKNRNVGVLITHGNGPQVGEELLRDEYSRNIIPEMPLYALGGSTQANIGMMLEIALIEGLSKAGVRREVVTILTHTCVKEDEALLKPTKPVGPFYTARELREELKTERFDYVKEKGHYRRVVPSPTPVAVIEADAIRKAIVGGAIVIACGGGGIPVIKSGKTYRWVNAVIDKDRTTQVIANALSAKQLFILTDTDYVYSDYPKNKKPIVKIMARNLKKMVGSFENGTMGPKIEASIKFIEQGGKEAHIGELFKLSEMLKRRSGTRIMAN